MLVLTAWLGAYGLWDPDEGRHAAIARELYAATTWRGWIIPSHNFADYHDKPILYYWLTSLAYRAVGTSEVGARLVSVLSALATLGAVFTWTATVADTRIAARAVLVLVTSVGFVCLGRYGSLDMLLTCWVTLGLVAVERYTADPRRRVFLAAAGAAAGLGMLTKGLVAPLFIASVPMLHAYVAGRRLPPARAWGLGLATFLLVATPWYVAADLFDPGYLREFFLQHHLARFTSSGVAFHGAPWWYYLPALALLLFPWSVLIPAAFVATRSRREPALRYCFCWAGLILVFFSCSRGKLATYILPALPPLAIVLAYAIDGFASTTAATRRLACAGLFVLAVVVAVAGPAAMHIDHVPWDRLVAASADYLIVFPVAVAILLAVWWRRGIVAATDAVAACTVGIVLVFYAHAAPLVSQVTSEQRLAGIITAHAEAPIVSYGVTPASLMFYVGRPVVRLNRARALRQLLEVQPFAWIVTSPRHVEEIARATPVYPWVTSGRHVLYATAPSGAVALADTVTR